MPAFVKYWTSGKLNYNSNSTQYWNTRFLLKCIYTYVYQNFSENLTWLTWKWQPDWHDMKNILLFTFSATESETWSCFLFFWSFVRMLFKKLTIPEHQNISFSSLSFFPGHFNNWVKKMSMLFQSDSRNHFLFEEIPGVPHPFI